MNKMQPTGITMKTIAFITILIICNMAYANNEARPGYVSDLSAPKAQVKGLEINEGFEDVSSLTGWIIDNQSNPVGSTDWFQGNDSIFNAQSGSNTSYIAANFSNGTGTDICNWLIMPDVGFLQTLNFWTRTSAGSTFPDRLLVLHSPTGGVNTGDCVNDFGDFTTTLLEINPTLSSGTYPEIWTQYSQLIDATGRVAFVYYIEDTANNGNYIGIDSVSWVAGLPETDLQLTSTYSPAENLEIGDQVTVTHTVFNNGPRDANGVNVDITVPEGLNYISNSCSAVVNDNNLTWDVGVLLAGNPMNCQVVVEITANGQQYYQASVSGDEVDNNMSNNGGGFNFNGPVQIIPVLNPYGLMLMSLLFLFVFYRRNNIITR